MPFDHEIYERERLVIVRGSGIGSAAEGLDSVRRLIESPDLDASYRLMFVVDEVTHDPSVEEVKAIAS